MQYQHLHETQNRSVLSDKLSVLSRVWPRARFQVLGGLTHWDRDQIDAISQTTFSNAFSRMKMNEFRLGFHWSLFLMFELTIFQLWFRLWLGADQATSHYLNQWWLVYWRIYASLGLNELTNDCTIPIVSTGTTGLYQPFCFNRKVATPYQWQPVRFLSRTPRHISSIASRVLPAIRGPLLLEMAIWIKTRRLLNDTMLNFGWYMYLFQ